MTRRTGHIFAIFCILILNTGFLVGQEDQLALARNYLEKRGEIIIEFNNPGRDLILEVGKFLSIDNVGDEKVRAYLNKEAFQKFLEYNIVFSILQPPSFEDLAMAKSGAGFFEQYPEQYQYDSIMRKFAEDYPGLCVLDTFGYSVQGRELLVVKLSDNVSVDEAEPEFYYTSTIHGDETLGFVLMLRLIDHLLSNYGSDVYITRLLNSIEFYINPLANPDGHYRTGGPTRTNINGVDLNRNFPDPWDVPPPDSEDYAQENIAQMEFMGSRHFVMSANFHSGAEVVNYPWDSFTSAQKTHPDDSWFQFISHEYADTVHEYSTGYMTGFDNGVTNGGDWYVIDGGRQDYVTYFLGGREVTIDLDDTTATPENQLDDHWEYNYRSLLNYACQASYGVQGVVTDIASGLPLEAKVEITGHDQDSSMIFSEAGNGFYLRLLDEGVSNITFSAPEYYDTTIYDVAVMNYHTTMLNVELRNSGVGIHDKQEDTDLKVFPNPATTRLMLDFRLERAGSITFAVYNAGGQQVINIPVKHYLAGPQSLRLDVSSLHSGIYFLELRRERQVLHRKFILYKD